MNCQWPVNPPRCFSIQWQFCWFDPIRSLNTIHRFDWKWAEANWSSCCWIDDILTEIADDWIFRRTETLIRFDWDGWSEGGGHHSLHLKRTIEWNKIMRGHRWTPRASHGRRTKRTSSCSSDKTHTHNRRPTTPDDARRRPATLMLCKMAESARLTGILQGWEKKISHNSIMESLAAFPATENLPRWRRSDEPAWTGRTSRADAVQVLITRT